MEEPISPKLQAIIDRAVEAAVAKALATPPPLVPADSKQGWLSVREMIPHMPAGHRSDKSVRGWITKKLLRAVKEDGRWSIDPQQAFADVNRVTSRSTFLATYKAEWKAIQEEKKRRPFGAKKYGAKRRPE